jgi:Integral membrane protein TerC family
MGATQAMPRRRVLIAKVTQHGAPCAPASGLRAAGEVQDATPSDIEEETRKSVSHFGACVAGAVAVGAGIYAWKGGTACQEYFAGYLLEQSLSIDNLFVFILCFDYFSTPKEYQDRVLTYGIWSAAVLRLIMILAGVELVENFKPLLLVFAGILVYSSAKILIGAGGSEEEADLSDNVIVKAINKARALSKAAVNRAL